MFSTKPIKNAKDIYSSAKNITARMTNVVFYHLKNHLVNIRQNFQLEQILFVSHESGSRFKPGDIGLQTTGSAKQSNICKSYRCDNKLHTHKYYCLNFIDEANKVSINLLIQNN